jgi:hypothetical protein
MVNIYAIHAGAATYTFVMPVKAGIQYPLTYQGSQVRWLLDRPVEPGDDKERKKGWL